MKQIITLNENQLNRIVMACVKSVLEEGLFKTYNQRNTYRYGEHPEYMSKEYRKMYDLDRNGKKKHVGWDKYDSNKIGVIQRDIKNLGDIINGKVNPFEKHPLYDASYGEIYLTLAEHGLESAKRYNLQKYEEYLTQLIQQVEEIMKNDEQAKQ